QGSLSWHVLDLDVAAEVERIAQWLREATARTLKRRGLVVATSGGIDSSVCLALAVRALGAERVQALVLPERDSSPDSADRAVLLTTHLGVAHTRQDISETLEAIGCYESRDAAARRAVPEYGPGWRMKIVIRGGLEGRVNHFNLIAQSPSGLTREVRLNLS